MERRHEMIAALLRDPRGDRAAVVEIVAGDDQLRAKTFHRGILLHRVALRNDDDRRNAVPRGGDGDGLAVIAAGRRHDAFRQLAGAAQRVEIDEPAAHLECAGRGMVLVLDEDFDPGPLLKERPGIGRCRRHERAHDCRGLGKCIK